MAQAAFLRALFEHGRVRVGQPTDADNDTLETDQALREWDEANRVEFPGEAPQLALSVARWAGSQFYRACQFAVYRDIDSATIAQALTTPCPAASAAEQHYAVDLIFRFLPELYRLARTASADDPLCEHLRQWASAWPLSSVGMAGVNLDDVSIICNDAGLLRLYVDRIAARRDASRLSDPRVRVAMRAALGYFDVLAPQIAAELNRCETDIAQS